MDELLDVTAVEVIGDHRLRLAFEDGTVGEVDFSGHRWRGVFEPHADPAYFARVTIDPELGTITWPNGTDMAPEPLLEKARRNPCASGARSPRRGAKIRRRGLIPGMPRLSSFYGITILIYWDEGAHGRPHFHAQYAGQTASIDLEGRVIAGMLPRRALVLVREWTALHQDELSANWELARRRQPLEPIQPLG